MRQTTGPFTPVVKTESLPDLAAGEGFTGGAEGGKKGLAILCYTSGFEGVKLVSFVAELRSRYAGFILRWQSG
jgi:hypothetical protein